MTPTITNDYSVWGVEAHGVRLHINAPVTLTTTKPWVLDIENNQDGSCAGIGITNDNEDIFFFTEIRDKEFFKDAHLVGHNIKYDIQMLRKWGFNVSPDQIVWDTQIAEYVKNSTTNRYGLKDLAKERYSASYPEFKELCGKGEKAISIGELPVDLVANYNGCDVLYTYKLFTEQIKSMTATEVAYMDDIELPTLRVLVEMEERGVQIDAAYIKDLDSRFEDAIGGVVKNLRDTAGFAINLNSHKQVKQLLLDKCGLRLKDTKAETLTKHESISIVKDILRHKQLSKLKETYTSSILAKLDDKSRLHGRFNQTVTDTSRLSSSEPNLQNIPTGTDQGLDVRKGFIAPAGQVLYRSDYSQVELRVLAHICEDPLLNEAFRTGEDIHTFTSRQINADRDVGKTINFAIVYGSGAYNLKEKTGISLYSAQSFMTLFENKFSGIYRWKEATLRTVRELGYATTLFGRRVPWFLTKNCKKHKLRKDNKGLPCGVACEKRLYAEADRRSISAIVQGSAAEILKLSLIATREFKPVLTVHDEIVFERPTVDEIPKIKELMENVVGLRVPLVVEIKSAINWSDSKHG